MSSFTVNVGSVMNRTIISVDVQASLKEAVRIMIDKRIGSLLTRRGGDYVGMITERDVLGKAVLQGLDVEKTKVESLMSSPLISVDANASLFEASRVMLERNIRRLLVTENGKVRGIVTQRDLTRAVLNLFLSFNETVAGI